MPYPKTPLHERLTAGIVFTDTCWLFRPKGKGRPAIWSGGARHQGKKLLAYRVAYEFYTGCSIPDGMVVDHECGNERCCNPEHLQLVTREENSSLGSSKHGQRMTECRRGHPRVSGQGECRTCKRDNMRRYRADFISG